MACATSSACHSSSSVASGLPYRRLVATVPEKRYGFCGTSPTVLGEQRRLEVAHVHAVDEDLAVGRVEEPRYEPEQRRLAAARRPDDRGRLARPGHQVDDLQHRLLGARVAEPGASVSVTGIAMLGGVGVLPSVASGDGGDRRHRDSTTAAGSVLAGAATTPSAQPSTQASTQSSPQGGNAGGNKGKNQPAVTATSDGPQDDVAGQ